MKKIIFLAFFIFIFFSACSKHETTTQRIAKKEVLYKFTKQKDNCTEMIGQANIKTTPEKSIKIMSNSLNDLGYISIKNNKLDWKFPWPFNNIKEKIKIKLKNKKINITGSGKLKYLTFSFKKFNNNTTLLTIKGVVCTNIPSFLQENIFSSCIKKIVKTARDKIE